jgi:iron-sulfur cluster repair protein YtfE (RIC family)
LTSGYESPMDAPPKYTELMRRLRLLADDMESHVHIEDKLLFPQAVLIEESHIT